MQAMAWVSAVVLVNVFSSRGRGSGCGDGQWLFAARNRAYSCGARCGVCGVARAGQVVEPGAHFFRRCCEPYLGCARRWMLLREASGRRVGIMGVICMAVGTDSERRPTSRHQPRSVGAENEP